MTSVTGRVNSVKQPRGGYVPVRLFQVETFDDGKTLHPSENVHPSIIGLAVDYLTRFLTPSTQVRTPLAIKLFHDAYSLPCPPTEAHFAFDISLNGAGIAEHNGKKGSKAACLKMIDEICGLDDRSIINACKLSTFDVWYRNASHALASRGYEDTNPDSDTIENIRIMVQRTCDFFSKVGPVVEKEFNIGTGISKEIVVGDGDYMTEDTIWDLKVLRKAPTPIHSLQLLVYRIMGQHSDDGNFNSVIKLGIFNPRLYKSYVVHMKDISEETVKEVERDVICYEYNDIDFTYFWGNFFDYLKPDDANSSKRAGKKKKGKA